jgi:hypothetical protein
VAAASNASGLNAENTIVTADKTHPFNFTNDIGAWGSKTSAKHLLFPHLEMSRLIQPQKPQSHSRDLAATHAFLSENVLKLDKTVPFAVWNQDISPVHGPKQDRNVLLQSAHFAKTPG